MRANEASPDWWENYQEALREAAAEEAEAAAEQPPQVKEITLEELKRQQEAKSKSEQPKEKKTKPGVKIIEMVCAADVKMRSAEFLSYGHLLRGGLELLTGLPGKGKSQVRCALVACATAGLPWPTGAPAIEPINVIMITAEDKIDTALVPRLEAAGADL
jgi:AAA domain